MLRIFQIAIFKTLYFNLKYLPFKQAVRLPIIIYKGVIFNTFKGNVKITTHQIKLGIIQIGKKTLGNIDLKKTKTIWEVNGSITFSGSAIIGQGSKITVGRYGILSLGKNFVITGGGTTIICNNNINFGNDCLLSWNILIMDTDFHKIINENNEIMNNDKPINIGNHIWIGCRNTILKGVTIYDNNVVAANSTITSGFYSTGHIIGNNGKVLKSNIKWDM